MNLSKLKGLMVLLGVIRHYFFSVEKFYSASSVTKEMIIATNNFNRTVNGFQNYTIFKIIHSAYFYTMNLVFKMVLRKLYSTIAVFKKRFLGLRRREVNWNNLTKNEFVGNKRNCRKNGRLIQEITNVLNKVSDAGIRSN